jgi:hypothetical protein
MKPSSDVEIQRWLRETSREFDSGNQYSGLAGETFLATLFVR